MSTDQSHPTVPSGPSTLLVVIIILACAATSMMAGNLQGAFDGRLIDTDSYARVSRIEAMLEAGRLLHHTPRDNGGLNIPLHWTHLLDGLILLLALPLRLFFPLNEALRLAGAAIGPLSTAMVALAAFQAVRLAAGSGRHAITAAVLAAVAPGIVAYGAFGRADHHVMLAAIAVVMPALAYVAGIGGRGLMPAAIAGGLGGLGIWMSPEALALLPFAWGIAALRDIEAERRVGPRALALAGGHLAVMLFAWLIDPPSGGHFAVEVDRLSMPFVELAAGMFVVQLMLRRLMPPVASPWLASILAGATLALPLLVWAIYYAGVAKRPGSVLTPDATERIWQHVAELRPATSPENLALLIAFPALVLAASLGVLLWRKRTPMTLLLAVGAAFLLYIGVTHIRFAMYLELAAVVALGVVIEIVARREAARAWRLALVVAWLGLLLGPFALSSLMRSDGVGRPGGACDPRPLRHDLAPLAGQILLTPMSDAPEILYFSRVVTVAGPYHRAERQIIRSADAFDETKFAGTMPASFAATGARAVLMCAKDQVKPDTFAAALKDGRPPDWLVERPLDPKSGYRLYVVR